MIIENITSEAKSAATNAALGFEGNKTLGVSGSIAKDHIVTIKASFMGSSLTISAMCPQNFSFDLQSTWAQKDSLGISDAMLNSVGNTGATIGSGNSKKEKIGNALSAGAGSLSKFKKALGATSDIVGVGGATVKIATAHYWQGASPISFSLPFEFVAQEDPQKEVIEPIKELYKLAAPYEFGADAAGVLIPPGPSVAGYVTGAGLNISVYIGRNIVFNNVIVDSVTAEIDTRPAKDSGKILYAKAEVSFSSFFAVSRKDIDSIFGA